MKNKSIILFIVLCVSFFVLEWLSKALLHTEELLMTSLSEQLTIGQIEKIIAFREKWQWVGYGVVPVLLFLKISVIALLLDIGCFFFNKKLSYKQLFDIVLRAEFIFLLVPVLKIGWFYFFQKDFTLEDLQFFYPLSALSLVGYKGLEVWFIYPFQVLNLFEAFYWWFLAHQLDKIFNEQKEKGLSIVVSGYGVGLLLWVVGVMFFTLNNA
ncbi:hypothetical protein [Capnocytophaga cynodegmi]|uniref:Yip1 domain-containing protein n=1 Tax=Capnocytophaga cynodegmi TaxID=28189 RepID=A0A0B7HMN5_9FLAO|nr:hypothetical protein [Capnocytophaga cynodegmi]CEN38748.1 conserved membrane hypothetical protein [Capnocytophaga cynodegmi]